MAAVPVVLLLLGSLLLGLWRRPDGRRTRLIEAAFAAAALVGALLIRPSIPSTISFVYLGPELAPSPGVRLDLSPWSWSLLVAALGFVFVQIVLAGPEVGGQKPMSPSAWLGYAGAIGLSILAANVLTLILTWALVIAVQSWLLRGSGKAGASPWGFLSTLDLAAITCLLAAGGGLVQGTASDPAGRPLAYALLLGAGSLRLASGLSPGGSIRKPDALRLGGLTAVSVLAMLSVDFGQEGAQALDGWLILIGVGLLLLAGTSWLLAPPGDQRWPAWAMSVTGAAALAAGVSPTDAALAFAASGAVLVLVEGMATAGAGGTLAGRVGSILAALTSVGAPTMVGAILLAVLAGSGVSDQAAPLRWIGILGLGALSSKFLSQAIFATPAVTEDRPAVGVSFVALAVMATLGVILFAYLLPMSASPSRLALVVSLGAMAGGTAVWRAAPSPAWSRLGRSFRWPRDLDLPRGARSLGAPIGAAVRGLRDLLEGDASLLWAFVVLLIALLALRGPA